MFKTEIVMGIDKTSGLWGIAVSYAHDEARDRGMRNGYMPRYRYVRDRAPIIYELLTKKQYHYEKIMPNEYKCHK